MRFVYNMVRSTTKKKEEVLKIGDRTIIVKEAKSGGTIIIEPDKGLKHHVIPGSQARDYEVMNPQKEYVDVIETTDGKPVAALITEVVRLKERPVLLVKDVASKKKEDEE